MALHGNLRDFAATEILQLLASQKKSGCLTLESDQGRACFYVWEGRIVSGREVGMPQDDPLLYLLVRAKRLSDEQVQGIRTIHQESGRDLEDLLVNGRYLEGEELATFLERQILDLLMRCVQWTSGTYEFDPNQRWPNAPYTRLSVEAAVIEAARRVDEQKRHRRMFADPQQILAVRDLPDPDDAVSDDELEMFEILDGRRTVTEIVAIAPLLEYESYEALHRMFESNWIAVIGRSEVRADNHPRPHVISIESSDANPSGSAVLMKEVAMALVVLCVAAAGWFAGHTMRPENDGVGDDLFVGTQIREVRSALDFHHYQNGKYPERLDMLVSGWWLPEDRVRIGGRLMSYEAASDGQSYALGIE